jgi:hypothetical protein
LIDHDVAIVPRGSVYLDASHKVKQNKAYEGRPTVLTWLQEYFHSSLCEVCTPRSLHAGASVASPTVLTPSVLPRLFSVRSGLSYASAENFKSYLHYRKPESTFARVAFEKEGLARAGDFLDSIDDDKPKGERGDTKIPFCSVDERECSSLQEGVGVERD